MNASEIQKQLMEYYEEAAKNINWDAHDNNNLEQKLLYTTEQFVRSFEYDLPREHSFKGKIKRFIQKIVRKMTRFLLRPYAEQNLRFQESLCELLGEMIVDKGNIEGEVNNAQELLQKCIKLQHENYEEYLKQQQENCELILKQQQENCNLSDKLYSHEEAIYNLSNNYNEQVKFALDLSGKVAVLNDRMNGGEDTAFRSYSQAGEDAIVWFLLNYGNDKEKIITYLDIGCNHYKVLNNTFSFYQRGNRGVLVEANPNFIDELKKYRQNDIVLNMGVGSKASEHMKFYITNNVDLSSFDLNVIENAQKESDWIKIVDEVDVPMTTITDLIEQYFSGPPTVVSIDVEGLEMSILSSLDFEKYRPYVFIIETINYSKHISVNNKREDILQFMRSNGYEEYAFTGVNSIFIDIRNKGE